MNLEPNTVLDLDYRFIRYPHGHMKIGDLFWDIYEGKRDGWKQIASFYEGVSYSSFMKTIYARKIDVDFIQEFLEFEEYALGNSPTFNFDPSSENQVIETAKEYQLLSKEDIVEEGDLYWLNTWQPVANPLFFGKTVKALHSIRNFCDFYCRPTLLPKVFPLMGQ